MRGPHTRCVPTTDAPGAGASSRTVSQQQTLYVATASVAAICVRPESAPDGGVVFGEVSRVFRRNVDGERHNVGEHATNGTGRVLDNRNDGRRYV